MSRYLLVTTEPAFAERLSSVATGELGGHIHSWTGDSFPGNPELLFAQQSHSEPPQVVLLGPGVPLDEAFSLASAIDTTHPGISVLLVHPPHPEVTLSAMRAGVRDLYDPANDAADLTALLYRAVNTSQRRRSLYAAPGHPAENGQSGRVIAVVSPKGGAGKTTIATNLAIGLAASAPHATVLVDLDLQFGDVAHALQLVPEQTLADAVQPQAQRDTMVLKSYLSPHPSGLYALCAPDSPADEARVSSADVSHLIDQLSAQYRFVILDTGAGLSDLTLAALDKATDYVFVTGTDVPGIRGLRKELDVLKELGMVPATQHIVLNGADPRDGLSVQDVQSVLGHKVDVTIPFSRGVRLSINQGRPLLQTRTRDKAAKPLHRLLNRFMPAPLPAPKKQSTARHRKGNQ